MQAVQIWDSVAIPSHPDITLAPYSLLSDPSTALSTLVMRDFLTRFSAPRGESASWQSICDPALYGSSMLSSELGTKLARLGLGSCTVGSICPPDHERQIREICETWVQQDILQHRQHVIYRRSDTHRIVDATETVVRETESVVYYVAFFMIGSDKELIIGTTQPELVHVAQAIAIHPDDKRYKKFLGQSVVIPLTDIVIPVITDTSINMHEGYGTRMIVPAHDALDHDIASRHQLPVNIRALDDQGVMLFPLDMVGKTSSQAREMTLTLLRGKGNLLGNQILSINTRVTRDGGVPVSSHIFTGWWMTFSPHANHIIEKLIQKQIVIDERYTESLIAQLRRITRWCISVDYDTDHPISLL
jgi:valyl-tRNA synthetase